MEILFVSHKYPPSIGGMQKQSYELIKGMEGVARVHTLLFSGQESKVKFFLLLKTRIIKLLRAHPTIDTIHLNDGSLAAFCTWLPAVTHIPVFVTLHGLDVVFPLRLYQLYILPEFNRFSKIICVSKATKNECIKRGIKPEKLSVVNNGVDPIRDELIPDVKFVDLFKRKYQIKPDERLIISIGRPVRRKGFSWFASRVLPHLSRVRYIVIGPYTKSDQRIDQILNYFPRRLKHVIKLFFGFPDDGADLLFFANQMVIKDQIILTGKLSFQEKLQLMSIADLFIMPNIKVAGDMEGFGLVALEAAAMDLPVIAAGIKGIKDAIQDGKNGYLLKSQDDKAWIDQIENIFKDETNIGMSPVDYTLRTFSWTKMAKAYEDIFMMDSERSKTVATRQREPSLVY